MKRALVAVVLAVAGSAHAQPGPPEQPDLKIDAAVRSQVIDAALAALHSRYVFPDVAAKIETAIRDRRGARQARGQATAQMSPEPVLDSPRGDRQARCRKEPA